MPIKVPTSLVSPSDTAQTGNTDQGDTADTDTPIDEGLSDVELLRAAINGDIDANDAFKTIASQGGFPVKTGSNTYLFACLCDGGTWSLTGTFTEWTSTPMTQSGSIWWLETTVDDAIDALYKFSDGENYIPDPYARRYGYDDNGEHSLVESSTRPSRTLAQRRKFSSHAPQPASLGSGKWGFDRTLFVHDAQNIFDPNAPWGGWKLQDSLCLRRPWWWDWTTRFNGWMNTPTQRIRIDGMEVGGLGDAYADYLHLEIRPFIETQYGAAQINGLMGASLGGLISLYTALRYPNGYDMAISLSGTVGWGRSTSTIRPSSSCSKMPEYSPFRSTLILVATVIVTTVMAMESKMTAGTPQTITAKTFNSRYPSQFRI